MKCCSESGCGNKVVNTIVFYDENTGELINSVNLCKSHVEKISLNIVKLALTKIASILM